LLIYLKTIATILHFKGMMIVMQLKGNKLAAILSIDIKCLKNRLLKVCYVPANSTGLPRLLFAAAINRTNEANKASSMHH
jgi:hypothetical protein